MIPSRTIRERLKELPRVIKKRPDADERLRPIIARMRGRAIADSLRIRKERLEAERIMMQLRLFRPKRESQ